VVLLLAAMAFAMVSTAVKQTPTIDEPVYITAATVYLREHSVRFNAEHPPLGKLVMAAGLAFARPRLDAAFSTPARSSYGATQRLVSRHLMYESGNDPGRLLLAARLPMIVLTLLFGLVVFAFARDLTGTVGGVVALAVYAFSPDLIAHGSLATLDVAAAGFVLTAVWLLWRGRHHPRWYLPLAGVALGAALATRANTLAAVPVLLALILWHGRRDLLRAAAWAAGFGVIAVAVVWVAYLAVDPRLRWTQPANVPVLHGWKSVAADLLPFPPSYRDGVRLQFVIDARGADTFLFGHHYDGPVWYYLPAAMLVKTPLGMLVLWLAAVVTLVAVPRFRPVAAYLLVPAAVLFAVMAAGNRDYGTRYAVFVPMFGAVAAATVVTLRWRWVPFAAAALVLFVAVSSALAYPYYLPYSNEAFGGPSKTYLRLHDSNVDWGQDLGRLAERLRTRYPGQPVWLSYKGSGVPAYYGIQARNPLRARPDQVRGLLVVSDTNIDLAEPPLKALIASSRPIDQVGHSITIFRR
jgi:4-amino-4-deoxy-L-arabinose transferase-like glycosyltransferase